MKSIKSRLIVSILVITIIPIIAFLVYSLVFVSDDQIESNLEESKTKISWATQHMNSKIEQLEDVMYSMHIEENLLTSVDDVYESSTEIESILRNALYTNANLANKITVISNQSNLLVSLDYENGLRSQSTVIMNPYHDLQGIPMGVGFSTHQNNIVAYHTINDFQTQEELGVIIIQLNQSLTNEFDSIFGDNTDYLIFSSNEMVYASNETNIEEENLLEKYKTNITSYQDDEQYIWIRQISNNDVYLASLIDSEYIDAFNNQLITTGLLIIFISLAVTIPTAIILSNKITMPIIKLVDHMNEFEFSHVKGDIQNYDEINLLEKSYNKMIDEMSLMIKERYKNKIDIQSAQLKALQAQINPHFLANTFQLIGGMALNVDAEDIYDATIKMSNMVRYSMKINEDSTTIKEELQHIENYLSIQKLRFGDQLDFQIDIPARLKSVPVPKLTLQPIIENAFKHGFKHKEGLWSIKIHCEMNEDIVIHIIDNGSGMDEKTRKLINQQFIERENHLIISDDDYFAGIGLVNIDSRIKLLYGKEYGIKLLKAKQGGVEVTMNLPKEVIA